MKAVILAAGVGSRLRPITDNVPKCMVQVYGECIIDRQIRNLKKSNVHDIVVIGGYKVDKLQAHIHNGHSDVLVIDNERYSETNNMYSLFLAKPHLKGKDFILMNADVFHDECIVSGLLEADGGSRIACDKEHYLEESMKIRVAGNRIVHISKQIPKEQAYATSIDIYRIAAPDSIRRFEEIEQIIADIDAKELRWIELAEV